MIEYSFFIISQPYDKYGLSNEFPVTNVLFLDFLLVKTSYVSSTEMSEEF